MADKRTRSPFAGVVIENQRSVQLGKEVARVRLAAGTSIANAKQFIASAFDRLLADAAEARKAGHEIPEGAAAAVKRNDKGKIESVLAVITIADGMINLR